MTSTRIVALPRLEQPALGRPLGSHPDLDERLERALGVTFAHEEVDVVIRRRAAVRPGCQAAAEKERNLGLPKRRRTLLHRVEELREGLARRVGHGRVYPTAGRSNRRAGTPDG